MRQLFIVLVVLISSPSFAQQGQLITGSQEVFGVIASPKAAHVPNEFLIQTEPGMDARVCVAELNQSLGGEVFVVRELVSDFMRVWRVSMVPQTLSGGTEVNEDVALDWLKDAKGISIAQRNHIVAERDVPDDPFYGSQWHHQNANDHDIDSDLAWEVTTGGSTATGDDIVICVVETGGANWALEDLAANHWVNNNEIPNNGVDDDDNGYIDDYDGWNVQNGDDNIPTGNHGSQVSGMAGAVGNNGIGISGVNWNVKLMQVRMGGVSEANAVAAYTYPLVMRKMYNETNGESGAFVVVTNSSWGTDFGQASQAPLWCAMYDSLGTYGVLSCGATANNNVNIDVVGDLPTTCPSNYMIGVTATDNNDIRDFSGYGTEHVDLGAPGDQVFLANNSGYNTTSGTSFASPCVAGAIALLYSAPCPNLILQAYADPAGVASLIRQYILEGTDFVDNLSDEVASGGRLNVNNSLQLLLEECQTGDCISPFAVEAIQLPGSMDYFIVWGTVDGMNSFSVRYRVSGEATWTEITGVNVDMTFVSGLLSCTEYEVQVMAFCDNGESEWSQSYFFTTDGCCVNPDSASFSVEYPGDGTAVISWEEVTAADGYLVNITVNGNELEPQEAAENSYSFTFEPCAEYVVSVFSICTGIEPAPNQFTFFTPGCGSCQDITYCDVTGDADLEHIARVVLGSIDNATASDGGYGDYTEFSTDLNAGSTYLMSVEPGYSGFSFSEQFKVWIDYNADGEFAQGTEEEIFASASNITSLISFEFTVPESVTPGTETRMRVSMSYGSDSSPTNACGDLGYGEAEDYCIGLLPVSVAEAEGEMIHLYPNPAENYLVIDNVPQGSILEIFDSVGKKQVSRMLSSGTGRIDTTALANGPYVYKVSTSETVHTGSFVIRH